MAEFYEKTCPRCSSRDSTWLIAVVFGSDQRDIDAILLLDAGFNKSKSGH